jgi:hypothetical protein
VFGSHWREFSFWKWWWRERAPIGLRVGTYVFLLALMLTGGWLAANRVSSAGAASATYPLETTQVEVRTITVRQQGKLVRRVVRVVKRVRLRPETILRTETSFGTTFVTTPGGVRLVREQVVKYVPHVRTRVITVGGKTRTVTETHVVPTTTVETRTETNVVTGATRVLTETRAETTVVTDVQTVVDQRTVTETETQTNTRTVTETVPVTVTVTETTPPETVTVTTSASGG